jgi:hypothetical protein
LSGEKTRDTNIQHKYTSPTELFEIKPFISLSKVLCSENKKMPVWHVFVININAEYVLLIG